MATQPLRFGSTDPVQFGSAEPLERGDGPEGPKQSDAERPPIQPASPETLMAMVSEVVQKILTQVILMAAPILKEVAKVPSAKNFLDGVVQWVEKRLGLPEDNVLRKSYTEVMDSFAQPGEKKTNKDGGDDNDPPAGGATLAVA